MGLRRWFIARLGGSEVVDDPNRIVEVGYVALSVSQILVVRLAEAGIHAVAEEDWRSGRVGAAQLKPTARILVRLDDLEDARPIVDGVSAGW